MRSIVLIAAALLSLTGCATPTSQPATASANHAGVPGMVSAADPRAAEAGAAMLRKGGSAADAAIATLVALNVVEPQSSGIGGGGFLVYRDGSGTIGSYDGRETAPAAATGTWFYRDGKPLPFSEMQPGGRSVGVPGNVRMMALAHAEHGRLPWKDLFAPAIALARDGFVMTARMNNALDYGRATGALDAAGRALYYGANGEPLPVGTRIKNPAMAAFLTRLAEQGPDSFYVGPNGQAIAAKVSGSPVSPAPMTPGDLASYDAKARDAVCGTYRGYKICGMGPPSSGATTVFAILKQLERFDMKKLGPDSPKSWHLIAESMRLAYADRGRYLADSDYLPVPVAGLTDPAYLAKRSLLIDPDHAMATAPVGTPPGAQPMAAGHEAVEHGTSHFVAVDRWGEVASLTSTIESAFGSGLVVNGYYLNNELTDFSSVPQENGLAVANRVEGGKRPRSSMSPSIVLAPDGSVRLAVGAAGGATIIAQVAKAIIGVIDWDLSAQDAIALPVLYAPGDTVYLEQGSTQVAMAPALRAMGHVVDIRSPGFKANAIEWRGGAWVGAADPRSEGGWVKE
ncbi:gamma-glutamyltransferase [Sphingorhabdus soli]|uniref:Glutathione hydrolase proenzyme n=1 Tax=Flavisphingopyxis soli TaxID=2601267 RepID=A0A5C6UND3_9SPHN|nr:gamma-glutamyltransferase [Sphingorhabdus soli]TXC73596.1 gamma-glutamyltransferase [Sphingorhabdus soli]